MGVDPSATDAEIKKGEQFFPACPPNHPSSVLPSPSLEEKAAEDHSLSSLRTPAACERPASSRAFTWLEQKDVLLILDFSIV